MTVIQPANWKESTFYREAVDNVVFYNTQLSRERKARLPYHDAQTGIAQSDCYIWRSRLERRRGVFPGQIYSYPPRRWRVEGKPPQKQTTKGDALVVGAAESAVASAGPTTTVTITPGIPVSVSSGVVHVPEAGAVIAKKSSRIANLSRKDEETSESSEGNEEESSDIDVDYMEDYDSEEERRQRKKKALVKSAKSTPSQQKTPKNNDKPFLCTICNRRYKTASTLKAHTTQHHAGGSDPAPTVVEKIPVKLSPPPNLQGKPCAKPNPYCDFCLGEDSLNKKSGKPEKMVSCADCGRSAHPSCLQFTLPLAKVVLTYRWQCIECKSCHLCGTSDNDDQLLFCDDCDRGYHMYCLKPPIKEPPEGSWSCGLCLKPVLSTNATKVVQ